MRLSEPLLGLAAVFGVLGGCAALPQADETGAGHPALRLPSLRLGTLDPVKIFLPEPPDDADAMQAPRTSPPHGTASTSTPTDARSDKTSETANEKDGELGEPASPTALAGASGTEIPALHIPEIRLDPDYAFTAPGQNSVSYLALPEPIFQSEVNAPDLSGKFAYDRPEFTRERDDGTFFPLEDEIIVKSRRTYQFEETGVIIVLEGALDLDEGVTSRMRLYRRLDD